MTLFRQVKKHYTGSMPARFGCNSRCPPPEDAAIKIGAVLALIIRRNKQDVLSRPIMAVNVCRFMLSDGETLLSFS
jgi:hypothetical protein